MKDKNRKLLHEKNEILRRCEEYCSELYTHGKLHDANVLEELKNMSPPPQEAGDDEDILREEVDWAIKKLKNNKSTDCIPAELIKDEQWRRVHLILQVTTLSPERSRSLREARFEPGVGQGR